MPVTLTADDVNRLANWSLVIDALRAGHRLAPADIADSLVHARNNTMLGCAAPGSTGWGPARGGDRRAGQCRRSLPSVHAQITLFDDVTGQVTAGVDGTSVTAWKTAADSALGADLLETQGRQNLAHGRRRLHGPPAHRSPPPRAPEHRPRVAVEPLAGTGVQPAR